LQYVKHVVLFEMKHRTITLIVVKN